MTLSNSGAGALGPEPARPARANGNAGALGPTRGTVAAPADAFAELLLALTPEGEGDDEATMPVTAIVDAATGESPETAGTTEAPSPAATTVPMLASPWFTGWTAVSGVAPGTAASETAGSSARTASAMTAAAVDAGGRGEAARVGPGAGGGKPQSSSPADVMALAGPASVATLIAGAAGGTTPTPLDSAMLPGSVARVEGDTARGGVATGTLLAGLAAPMGHASDALRTAERVHESMLPSHPMDAAFAVDLAAEVRLMAREGLQEARLHLNPVELGPVHVRLLLDDGTADLLFSAEHAATREGLQQALPELRERLAAEGFLVGEAAITSGQAATGGFGRAGGQAAGWQAQQPRNDGPGGFAPSTTAPTGGGDAPRRVSRPSGLLDLYA